MDYLRHFPLTVWVAVALALGGLLAVGAMRGDDSPLPSYAALQPPSERPAALAALQRVSGVYPALASGNVEGWSQQTAAQFEAALDAHIDATGTADDQLGIAWQNARIAALNLAAAPEEDRHVRAAALGQAVQYVVAVVDGLTLAPAELALQAVPPAPADTSTSSEPAPQNKKKGKKNR